MIQPRVVLDTNIYISGLVFGGVPRTLLVLARTNKFSVCVSERIQREVEATLARKFLWPDEKIEQACGPLWGVAHHIKTKTKLAVVTADPDDDRILECALDGNAGIVVTGDDHLLSLTPASRSVIQHIRIMTPSQFLNALA